MNKFFGILFLLFSFSTEANLSQFNERFELVRNSNGKLLKIIDKTMSYQTSFEDYVLSLANEYDSELDIEKESELRKYFKFKKTLHSKGVKSILNESEKGIVKPSLDKYRLMADLTPYKQREGNGFVSGLSKGVKWIAKKTVGQIPYVGDLLKFLLKKYYRQYEQANKFHRGILMYYLENFSASQLGMSKKEVSLAMTDIAYGWSGLIRRNRARNNWESYSNWFLMKASEKRSKALAKGKSCTKKLREVNSVFMWCKNDQNHTVAVNIWDSKKGALSFTSNSYAKIYQSRKKKELLCMLKSELDMAICKRFYKQIDKEGVLFADLKRSGYDGAANALLKQSMNSVIVDSLFSY